MKIGAICVTYKRPKELAAVIECFLRQDYPAELRELIVARAPIGQIKEAAARGGTRSLREAALALVKSGDTTLEEINRVTLVG